MPSLCVFAPATMDFSEQPRTGAAQRRKQRRLRSWWRHEQHSIVSALATLLYHSSRGQRKARAGKEENEPGGRRLGRASGVQEWVQRRTVEQLADIARMVPSLAILEPELVDQLVATIKFVDSVVPEQIIAMPKISWPSRFLRTVLREPEKREQLVEVLVPFSLSDWVRWEEAYRRTGHTWFDGFEQPRAVKKYWAMISSTPLVSRSLCSSSSTERWRYVVAVVPTVTHSANCAVLGRAG